MSLWRKHKPGTELPGTEPTRTQRLGALAAGVIALAGSVGIAGYLVGDLRSLVRTDRATSSGQAGAAGSASGNVVDPATAARLAVASGWRGVALTGLSPGEAREQVEVALRGTSIEVERIWPSVEDALHRKAALLAFRFSGPGAGEGTVVVRPYPLRQHPGEENVERSFLADLRRSGAQGATSERVVLPSGPALRFDYQLPGEGSDHLRRREYLVRAGFANWLITMSTDDPDRDQADLDAMAQSFDVG